MRFLRTNTAIRLTVGPFLDKTDGITPETGLTVTNCHLTLMVDDSNVPTLVLDASATASGGNNDMVHVTGDDAGFYDLELTAANLNYLGRAMLAITDAANHCPVFHEFMILPAMIYDSLVLGTDRLDTNVTHIADTAQTARDIGASVLLSSGSGTGQLDFTSGVVKANVTQFGGSNGTFASGRPEVNTTHIAGTAWASTTLFTLASHDPGATIGTSTLTQAQVTGGAYSVQSSSCVLGDARIANLDAAVSTRGTSTLTQTQVTGGAYSIQSASCVLGDARIANLDAAVSTRGTSTLTQTQVTGGAYNIQSASCVLGDARIANLDAAVSTRLASASYTSPPSAATIASTVLTTQFASESYNADGSLPTLAQGVLFCMQGMSEFSISGTTMTVKKLDGSTTAYTLTLNDATTPTAVTRSG